MQAKFRGWVPWKCRKGLKLQDWQQTIALETNTHQLYKVLWKVRNAIAELYDVLSKVRDTHIQLYDVFVEAGDATP